jgi:elongation factor G
MPNITTDRIRNVVLLSHGGAGKTILSEAMLFSAGVISRTGTVEDGTTTSDFEPEETRRGNSVQTSVLNLPWKNHKLNVIDTPGYADFRGEAISGIRVADAAVIVVASSSGVEVGTKQMWQLAEKYGLPRIIYISKMDRENADFQRVTDALADSFGRHCVPINIPIGSEASFSGVTNTLDPDSEVPEELQGEFDAARERLIEAVAETNDDLATKYLEGEELSQEELVHGLKEGLSSGSIVPILSGASPSGIGVKELMDAIVNYMPSPAEVGPAKATTGSSNEETSLACDSNGPLAALVFKTAADPFVGKLSYFRVYSGTFKSDSQLWNANESEAERVGQVFAINGKSQEGIPELVAGDIGAVAKMTSVLTGHTVASREQPLILAGMEFPHAVYRMAVFPKTKSDVDKMTSSLARISEEDPSLSITREPDTLQVLMGGLGDTHIDVAVEKMKRKFGVELELEVPKVPYKETIGAFTKVEYKHKKQSGGHGQYGHVWLELEPLSRGEGFEFGQKVVGGSVPREYIPSVEKGVQKAMADGAVAGFPIVDLRATLVDGSYHSVDSSGICYEIAGRQALTKGIKQASPVLLEPVMRVDITVPDSFTGDIIGDLNSKRGRIQGMVPEGGGITTVEADVPQAEMLRYATDLRSMTQGQGTFTMEYDHYEEVPQHLMQRVVDSMMEREEAGV